MTPSPTTGVLRFGPCELNPGKRELLRDGVPQQLPPREFDLLLLLVKERGRVVTKDELLDQIWGGADVSDNVLARAVMKIRRALGAHAEDPRLLRTVHRVGYCFEAPVVTGGPEAPDSVTGAAQAAGERPPPSVRLALMPVENLSGDPDLAWVAWGLPTLVGQALQSDRRLLVVPPASVRHVLEQLAQPNVADRRPAATPGPVDLSVPDLLGVQALVRASVQRSGDGLRMDYHSQGERTFRGTLKAVEATLLGQALAEAIEAGLFPDARSPVRFESTDPLASQAYARALDFSNQEEWAKAARLLRVVLDIVPGDRHARLHYVRMLANIHDPQAIPVGEALVQEASQGGDVRLLAAAHEGLGRALYNLEGPDAVARARHHMDLALELARPFAGEDWVIRIHLGQAVAAHMDRNNPLARLHYEQAWVGNEQSGNQMRRAMILNNRALLEASDGNLLVAREMAQQSLQLCQRFGLRANATDALSNLALIDAGLGLLENAATHCEAALAGVPGLPDSEHDAVAWVMVVAGELSWLCRLPALAERAFDLPGPSQKGEPLRVATAWSVACAYRVALEDPDHARALLTGAIEQAGEHGYLENVHQFLRRAVELWLRLGRWHELTGWFERIARLPRLADDLVLQATVLRARAALALSAGEPATAQQLLNQAVSLAPPCQAAGLARLDLADLQWRCGDAAAARRTLRDAGSWLLHHPQAGPLRSALAAPAEAPRPEGQAPAGPATRLLTLT